MLINRTAVLPTLAVCLLSSMAEAQSPQLTPSKTLVAPGETITVTITGQPGDAVALVSSTVGAGSVYAGQQFSVGADIAIVFMGTLDGTGPVAIPFTPPFRGTTLDRYYIQGVTSATAAFNPLALTPGAILRNSDVLGASSAPGPTALRVFG